MYCIGYFRHCNTDGYNRWEEQNLWVSSEEELIATVKGMQNNPIYKILGFSKETPMSKEEENKIYSEASKLSEKESAKAEKINKLNKLLESFRENSVMFENFCLQLDDMHDKISYLQRELACLSKQALATYDELTEDEKHMIVSEDMEKLLKRVAAKEVVRKMRDYYEK